MFSLKVYIMIVEIGRFSEYIFRHYSNELLTGLGTGWDKMIGHATIAYRNYSMAHYLVTFTLLPGDPL
jgi:hypothetical protein